MSRAIKTVGSVLKPAVGVASALGVPGAGLINGALGLLPSGGVKAPTQPQYNMAGGAPSTAAPGQKAGLFNPGAMAIDPLNPASRDVFNQIALQLGRNIGQNGFDLAQFQGPMSAELRPGQIDALAGVNSLFNATPLINTEELQSGIRRAASGDMLFDPRAGETINSAIQPYRLETGFEDQLDEAARTGFNFGPVTYSDLGRTDELINRVAGNDFTGRIAGSTLGNGGMQDIQNRVASSIDPAGVQNQLMGALFDPSLSSAGSPESQALSRSLLSNFNNALAGPSFDNTAMFKEGEGVMQDDLAREMANIRAEYSRMGLGPGSTDRIDAMTRAAGNTIGKFRLGQQEVARQSFENAQNRVQNTLGMGGMMSQIADQPFNRALQTSGLRASTLGNLYNTQQNAANNLLGMNFNALATGAGLEASMVPQTLNADTNAFREQMANAATVHNPAADRRLSALNMGMNQANVDANRMIDLTNAEAARRMAGTNMMFQAEQLPWQNAQTLFGMEEAARRVDDTDIVRQMTEFARTQGGGLMQALQFGQFNPQMMMAPTPSMLSQASALAQGASALPWDQIGSGVKKVGNFIGGLFK